jgi:hypothetical protein
MGSDRRGCLGEVSGRYEGLPEKCRAGRIQGIPPPRAWSTSLHCAASVSGLNLSKRGQVLQMHRRGQSPDQTAATLGLPRTEIDLLLKVHQIVLERVG